MLFLHVLEIVIPVFTIILLGFGLKRLAVIDDHFLAFANRLVFLVCLPALLFFKIGTADFFTAFNPPLILGCILGTLLGFLLSYVHGVVYRYPPAVKGAFCQAAFRGNLAYMGLAVIYYAYGEEGLTRGSLVIGFLVPLLNVLSVFALAWPHKADHHLGIRYWIRQIGLNPLLLASVLGVAWSLASIPMPTILQRSLDILTGMTLPLALLAIGAGFSIEKIRGDTVRVLLACTIKLVLMPLLTYGILRALGVQGIDLAIGFLLAASPTAAASYIMSDQMRGDVVLTGSIIMVSTLFSCVTYTALLLALSVL